MFSRSPNDLYDVLTHTVFHCHVANGLLHSQQFFRRRNRLQRFQGVLPLKAKQNDILLPFRRIAQLDLEQEAVYLRLRQRKSALQLDGVLGSQHHKRPGKSHRLYVHCYLPLLHRLQHGALGAGCGPVDLVGQDNLSHHRARAKLELLRLLVKVINAGHVRWEQIRGKLDAPKGAPQRAGHRLGQHRLANTRHVLDQHVPLTQQGNHHQLDGPFPADNNSVDVAHDPVHRRLNIEHNLFSSANLPVYQSTDLSPSQYSTPFSFWLLSLPGDFVL